MKKLHAKTLDELADLILGTSVGSYRTVKDIHGFFQSADPRFPVFDGIPSRSTCTTAFLQPCNREPITPRQNGEDPLDDQCLEAVILELADPRTYPNDRDTLQTVVDRLNAVLEPEGFEIIYDGHAPRLRGDSVAAESTPSTFSAPNRKVPDFSRLTSNALLVEELNARWKEANRCSEASAHLATVIVLGSILEAALQPMIHDDPMQANCNSTADCILVDHPS
jgi:hypothetical protein